MKQKPIPKPSVTAIFEHYEAQVLGTDTGHWQKATCALNDHDDRSPSASVNESECKWHCWGCDKSGDALDLVMHNEGIGFKEAIAFLSSFEDQGVSSERHGSGGLGLGGRKRTSGKQWTPPWAAF